MTLSTMRTGAIVAGLALAMACAGCGGSDDPAEAKSKPPAKATPEESTPPSPTFPKAADGKKVSACRDGKCEILVTKRTKIPIDSRFGLTDFSFSPTDLTWRYKYPEGGGGSMKFLEPPYAGSTVGPHGKQSLNMRVVASDGSKAVISLTPGN